MKPFNFQIIVYYVEKKGSNSAAGNKNWMSSSLLETDSSYGTSKVSLSKTGHSKLREELGEINFVLDWRGFKLLCAEYLLLRNDKCQIDLLLVAAPLHSAGLRISLQFSSWRRRILGKSWHVSPGMLSPHLLCGSAVFFRRNFYLTFTFFFFAFFFLFVCFFVVDVRFVFWALIV